MRTRSLILPVALLIMAAPVSASDLSGKWSGHWHDSKSGHTGPLKGTFHKCDDDHYRVTFTGRFYKVIPFRYSVVLAITDRQGDKLLLAGEQRLPLFGTFTYSAEAEAGRFVAHFCSKRYQGEFILERNCP